MKERPILFSGAMVRALLDGSKTQTRRVVKDDPGPYWNPQVGPYNPLVIANGGYEAPGPEVYGASDELYGRKFPYGQPGDRLWVRENWFQRGEWRKPAWPEAEWDDAYWDGLRAVEYAADGSNPGEGWRSRPSIHMPYWASRILLEVVSVRVERLRECSQSDAIAEGAVHIRSKAWDREHFPAWRFLFDEAVAAGEKPPVGPSPVQAYQALWEDINGSGSWDANPWVWVVEFKRVMP